MQINVNTRGGEGEAYGGDPARLLEFGRIEIDTEQILVLKDGLPIELSQREYCIEPPMDEKQNLPVSSWQNR